MPLPIVCSPPILRSIDANASVPIFVRQYLLKILLSEKSYIIRVSNLEPFNSTCGTQIRFANAIFQLSYIAVLEPFPSTALRCIAKMISPDDDDLSAPETPSTQPSSRIEADDSLDDEGYAESTSTSYVTSIATDIRRGIEENGPAVRQLWAAQAMDTH